MTPKSIDIDRFFESLMNWAATGRIVEDVYFAIRHYVFYILSVCNWRWLPFARQAERELKPYDKHLRPERTLMEKLGAGARPWVLLLIPVALAFATTALVDLPWLVRVPADSAPQASEISVGHLRTIATVLAALTGLFLTVIALTISIKTSKLAGVDFLINGVIRKRGFVPVAAFLLGTVLAILLGIVVSNRLSLRSLNDWTWAAGFLSVVSILALFRIVQRTMQTLATSELDQLLSGELLSYLRVAFRGALRHGLIEKYFSESLADWGFIRYPATRKEETHPIEYRLKRLGWITAVDPAPLKRISHILKLTPVPRDRNVSRYLLSAPCDRAPYITVQASGRVTKDTRLALLTVQTPASRRIGRLLRCAFVIRARANPDPPWERIRELMGAAIAERKSTTIGAVRSALIEILDDYLENQLVVAGEGRLLFEDFTGQVIYGFKPPDRSNLKLSELAVHAACEGAENCLDELLGCIYSLARKAFAKENQKYFRDWVFEFYWAYHSFGSRANSTCPSIGPSITRRIGWLNNLLSMDLHDASAEWVRHATPYAIVYLSLCMHMLKIAAERSDQPTFDASNEHLIHFPQSAPEDTKGTLDYLHAVSRQGSNASEGAVSGGVNKEEDLLRAYDQVNDYKNLVYTVTGAWLVHQVKDEKLELATVAPFIEKLIASTPDFRHLLDLYAMPDMADMATSHENPLGFPLWDWPVSNYSTARDGTDFERWIGPFYAFVLLKRAAEAGIPRISLSVVRQGQADDPALQDFLTDIAADKYTLPPEYENHPWSITPEDLKTAKDRIKGLLDSWAKQQAQSADGPDSSIPRTDT
jgi:hypothetical protein